MKVNAAREAVDVPLTTNDLNVPSQVSQVLAASFVVFVGKIHVLQTQVISTVAVSFISNRMC